MAKMNKTQESLISQLEHARVIYDTFEEMLAQEVADRKWEAKEHIRRLVREARDAGVPYRRIGFALKTSDHNTLVSYYEDKRRDGR